MKAIWKTEAKPGVVFRKTSYPKFSKDEVVVEVKRAGICGTDLHIFDWSKQFQNIDKNLPFIIGHECSGIIVDKGNDVEDYKIGERVAIETHLSCGKCSLCRTNNEHICNNLKIIGVHTNGCFRKFMEIDSDNLRLIPDNISFEIGVLLEPFALALRSVIETNIVGQSVLIIGCGPIGLSSIEAAKIAGASEIFVSNRGEFRRKIAKSMGIKQILNPQKNPLNKQIGENTIDVLIETSGSISALEESIDLVNKRGKIILLGLPRKPLTIDLTSKLILKEIQVLGIHGRTKESWHKAIKLIENKIVNLSPIITHEIHFSEFNKGIELIRNKKAGKVLMKF